MYLNIILINSLNSFIHKIPNLNSFCIWCPVLCFFCKRFRFWFRFRLVYSGQTRHSPAEHCARASRERLVSDRIWHHILQWHALGPDAGQPADGLHLHQWRHWLRGMGYVHVLASLNHQSLSVCHFWF